MSVTVLARMSRWPERIHLVLVLCLLTLISLTGCSSDHSFHGIYPTPAVQIPATPSAVTVTAGDSQNMLTWPPVNGATSYNIYWSNTSGVNSSNGTKMSGVTSAQYAHTSLTNGANYYYVVTAVNSAGESAASAEASAKPMPPIPAAPSGVTATAGDGQITVAWSPVSGATSYNIYWSNTPGVNTSNGTKIGSLTLSPDVHASLTEALTYYYVVTAVNMAGESGISSEASGMPLATGSVIIPLTPGTATSGTLNASGTPSFTFNFDGNEVTTSGSAIVSQMQQGDLPIPVPQKTSGGKQMRQSARAVASNTACTFVGAFKISVNPSAITGFATPALLSGNVDPATASGTTLNLAILQNSQWNYIATAVVGTNGSYNQNLPSVALPGILGAGQYLICQPESGGTTVSNLGVALVADDSNGRYGVSADTVQVVHLYDSKGNPLATPTVDYLNYPGAGDLDGQAMTPDGSQGILVDGGNTLRFFSKVQTGTPVADTYTLDIPYSAGGDGDSVAIMPAGDEAVVSADSSKNLLLVSGILSGSAVAADLITVPDYRDGVVISADGKVMLARGYSGLSVFAVDPIAAKPGSLGGTVAHSYTYVKDLSELGSNGGYDGRNGMAISPVDSTKAVVITPYGQTITLVTGLPNTPVASSPLDLSAAGDVYSVSVSPDGKTAVVGGEKGLLLISGVDTGSLAVVGSLFAPAYAGTSGNVTLVEVRTLGITLDGKYVAVCDYANSALLVIPVSSTGFGSPVGVLNDFAVPYNDQMLIH
jgi:fibronectin type 3 domain-containing protein